MILDFTKKTLILIKKIIFLNLIKLWISNPSYLFRIYENNLIKSYLKIIKNQYYFLINLRYLLIFIDCLKGNFLPNIFFADTGLTLGLANLNTICFGQLNPTFIIKNFINEF